MRPAYLCALMIMLVLGPAVEAAEVERGEGLHERHCTACHGTEVYERSDRRVGSRAALERQVARCTRAAGVDWNAQQIEAVVRDLDRRFYHFSE